MVELHPSKVAVAGSTPVRRSRYDLANPLQWRCHSVSLDIRVGSRTAFAVEKAYRNNGPSRVVN